MHRPDPLATFAADLRAGRGRAIQTARANREDASLREQLLSACEHHLAYDPQCEGTRTRYLVNAASALGAIPALRAISLRGLPDAEDWDVDHFVGLVAFFATRDDAEARAALVRHVREKPLSGDACAALVEIDGESGLRDAERGLLLAARTVAEKLTWGDEWIARAVQEDAVELFGEAAVEGALARAAGDDAWVARFREIVREEAEKTPGQAPAPRAATTFAQLMVALENEPPRGRRGWSSAIAWARSADVDEIVIAAEALRTEDDPEKLARLLRMFGARELPGAIDRVVELARHEDELVARQAIAALANLCRPEIRDLAWSWLVPPIREWEVLRLFARNALVGDGARVAALLAATTGDEGQRHGMASDVLEATPRSLGGSEWREPLVWAYAASPCSLCREQVVEKLLAADALSDDLREECRWDAREDTRDLVAAAQPAITT